MLAKKIMESSSYVHSSVCPPQWRKITESAHVKYALMGLITLAALACIAVGAIAYSRIGLPTIGNRVSINLLVIGVGAIAIQLMFLYLSLRVSVLSYKDAETYKERLKPGEFFVYKGGEEEGYQKMIYRRKSNDIVAYKYELNYSKFKRDYKEVSLSTLKLR